MVKTKGKYIQGFKFKKITVRVEKKGNYAGAQWRNVFYNNISCLCNNLFSKEY